MYLEREELIKRVFPRLRRLCEQRGVIWGEVDLRWGVTETEAAQGKVLGTCLAEIRNCRFFIGLLGERYGWVPDRLPPELQEQEPWLADPALSGCSVTELEVRHGVLNQPPQAEYALFYFRSRDYLKNLPAGSELADFQPEGADAVRRLTALKERLRAAGFPSRRDYAEPREVGEMILEDFTTLLDRLYPERSLPDPQEQEAAAHQAFADSLSRTYVGRQEDFDCLDAHAAGIGAPLVVCGGPGSGKSALLANWTRCRLDRATGSLRLSRSVWRRVLRSFRPRERTPPRGDLLLAHFVGATPSSTDVGAMLRHVLAELKACLSLALEIPEQPTALRAALGNALSLAAARGKVVLVLDGLDRLEDRHQALELLWLPRELPANVRLIVSAAGGRPLQVLRERGWPMLEVHPLRPGERRHLVADYLAGHSKRLPNEQVWRIAAAPPAANPLYLCTLLEELRVFGRHEGLADRIRHYLAAATVGALQDRVLARLEEDYDRDRRHLVRDTMTLLWAARRGLGESELAELLNAPGDPLPSALWSPLYLAARALLVNRSGLLTFFHEEARSAVARRYLSEPDDQRAARRRLVAYFAGRKWLPRQVEELPWQLAALGDWAELAAVLADPSFLRRAWDTSAHEVKSYWAQVEGESPFRLREAYRAVLADPQACPEVVWPVALLLGDTGHVEEALALGRLVEELARATGDRKRLQDSLGVQAVHWRRRGNLAEAMRLLRAQELICRDGRDRAALAANLGNQGVLLRDLGEPDRALALHGEAEGICRDLGDFLGVAACLGNQGVILRDRRDVEKAMRLFREQETLCRENGDVAGLHTSLGNQAAMLAAGGHFEEALRRHQEEEDLCRRLLDRAGLQTCRANQALILAERGDYDRALELLDEKETICREDRNEEGLAEALKQKAYLFGVKLGQAPYAVPLAEEALRLAAANDLVRLAGEIEALLNYLRSRAG
jgi:tetratricopeptide (TPR) repeat protein